MTSGQADSAGTSHPVGSAAPVQLVRVVGYVELGTPTDRVEADLRTEWFDPRALADIAAAAPWVALRLPHGGPFVGRVILTARGRRLWLRGEVLADCAEAVRRLGHVSPTTRVHRELADPGRTAVILAATVLDFAIVARSAYPSRLRVIGPEVTVGVGLVLGSG